MRSINGSRLLRGTLIVACCAVVARARADETAPAADRLFEQARADMKRGDFGSAREQLVDSLRLERTVGVLFNLALCEDKLGALGDSLVHLRAALDLAANDDRRRPLFLDLIHALEPRVPHLVLKAEANLPTGLELTVDGQRVDRATGSDLRVNPGRHEITVRVPDGIPEITVIQLNEGETLVKTILWNRPVLPDADEATIRRTEGSSSIARPVVQRAGAVAFTAGAAGVVTGAVLGFMALGRKVVVDHHCGTSGCDAQGSQASGEGKSLATASTLTAGAGFMGLALGGYLAFGRGTTVADRLSTTDRYAGYVGVAVAAAGFAVSAVAAGTTLSAQREMADLCSAGACQTRQAVDAAARGRAASSVSAIAFGTGIVGAGVASYALVLRSTFQGATDVRLTLSPSEIACSARF